MLFVQVAREVRVGQRPLEPRNGVRVGGDGLGHGLDGRDQPVVGGVVVGDQLLRRTAGVMLPGSSR